MAIKIVHEGEERLALGDLKDLHAHRLAPLQEVVQVVDFQAHMLDGPPCVCGPVVDENLEVRDRATKRAVSGASFQMEGHVLGTSTESGKVELSNATWPLTVSTC